MDPVVSLDAPKASLAPGDAGTVTVRVLNRGTTVESFRIDVVGPARGWATPPAEPLALFPDASGEAVVKFEVPAKNGPRAGTMRIGLRVAAISGVGGSTVEEFDLTIAPMVAVTAKLAPPNSRGWRKGRHRLLITNEGNIDTSVFLEARDPDELLDCRVSQEAVVPADDTVSVPLLVTPLAGGKLIGRPSAHPFEVEIFPNSGQAVALRGSMRQRPLLSPAVLVAAAVVLALTAAIIALSGSKPESTAQDKVNGSVLEQGDEPTSTVSSTSTSSTPLAPTTTITAALPNQAAELPSTTLAPGAASGAAPTANPSAPQTGSQKASQSGQPEVPAPAIGETPTETPPPATTATAAPTTLPTTTEPAIPSTPPMKFGPFYAGDGVIYVVTQNGDLNFYQDYRQDGSSNGVTGEGWNPNGGRRVGCGFSTVQHIFGAEGGVIYAVDSAGNFMYYKDLVRNGTNDACAAGGGWAGGWSMGSGWSGYKFVFYGGNGIIYAVDPSGNLRFCRDSGLDGSFDGSCPIIGIGWGDLRQVFASGAPGVIYAVNQAGDLLYFRDLLRNGTNNVNSGWVGPLPVGNTWQTMYHVFGGAINNPAYPQGVIYTVASDGTLQWRQDYLQDGSNGIGGNRGWYGYTTIGVGWNGVL